MRSWRRKKEPKLSNTIRLGDQSITIKPPKVHDGLRLGLLLIPYVFRFKELDKLLESRVSAGALSAGMRAITHAMIEFPGDLTKFVGLVIGRTPRWVAENTNAVELFEVLPTIVRVAKIEDLVKAIVGLGLISLEEPEKSDGSRGN